MNNHRGINCEPLARSICFTEILRLVSTYILHSEAGRGRDTVTSIYFSANASSCFDGSTSKQSWKRKKQVRLRSKTSSVSFMNNHRGINCEPLAQLVEHLTFNQRVEGSSPSWLTIFFLRNKLRHNIIEKSTGP